MLKCTQQLVNLGLKTKPLPAFGIPSIIFFIAAGVSTTYVVDFYNAASRLPLGMMVFTVLLTSIGFFFILAAIILYVLSRISSIKF